MKTRVRETEITETGKVKIKKAAMRVIGLTAAAVIFAGTALGGINTEASAKTGSRQESRIFINEAGRTQEQLLKRAKSAEAIFAKEIFKDLFQDGKVIPGMENYGAGLYEVFSLARSGYESPEFYDKVYQKLVKQLKDFNEKGETKLSDGAVLTLEDIDKSDAPMNIYAKAVLVISALGHDASDSAQTGGFKLIEKLLDRDMYEGSTKAYQKSVLMLLALRNYEFPKGEKFITEDELVTATIEDAKEQLKNASDYGADSALIAIQPLAQYVEENAAAKDISEKVLTYVMSLQKEEGGFEAFGNANNPWTNAQVMITMGCYNIKVSSENEKISFVKGGNTVIDNVMSYVDLTGKTYDKETVNFDSCQILRGLTAVLSEDRGTDLFEFDIKGTAYRANLTSLGQGKIKSAKFSKNGSIKLSIKKSKNADGYEVLISDKMDFNKNTVTKKTKKTTFKFKTSLKKNVYIKVRAVADDGSKGAYSKAVKVK